MCDYWIICFTVFGRYSAFLALEGKSHQIQASQQYSVKLLTQKDVESEALREERKKVWRSVFIVYSNKNRYFV